MAGLVVPDGARGALEEGAGLDPVEALVPLATSDLADSARRAPPGVDCQLQAFPAELPSGPPSREEPWLAYLGRRARGLRGRLGRVLGRIVRRTAPTARPPVPRRTLPAPDLRAGDLARVRSADYIRATLDENGYLHGCGFGRSQYQFCGKTLRVLRRVDHFFDEARLRMLKGRNLVLLEGAHCEGADVPWTQGCQRLCFYFWRTEWLEKVEG